MTVIQQIAGFFQRIAEVIGNVGDFLRSMIKFIYYAGKSVIAGFVDVVGFILHTLDGFFDYLLDVFDKLSFYFGDVTLIFVSLFLFIITMIIFQFIFRVFTGKYAIFNTKKK